MSAEQIQPDPFQETVGGANVLPGPAGLPEGASTEAVGSTPIFKRPRGPLDVIRALMSRAAAAGERREADTIAANAANAAFNNWRFEQDAADAAVGVAAEAREHLKGLDDQ